MKHIYLINNDSPASMYGVGTYIKQLLKCLDGGDMRVTIVNLESSQETHNISEENNIRTLNIPSCHSSTQEKDQNRYQKYVSFLLTYYIDSNEENIFHFNFLQYCPMAKMLREQYPNCRILLTLHYINWLMELKGNSKALKPILKKEEEARSFIEKWIAHDYEQNIELFNCVDKVICLSTYTHTLLSKQLMITPQKLEVIYNGLENNGVRQTKTQLNILRNELKIKRSEKIILFVGRVDKLKGVEALIDAFRITLKSIPNARLIIAGNGDYNLCLEKSIDIWTKITFTGKIAKEKVDQLYQIADLGVIPSFCEQCSYTAIEMMMHGLPFVGTSSTGLKEMLDDRMEDIIPLTVKKDEVLLPSVKLAQRLTRHLSHPKKIGKRMYLSRYSLECMKSQIVHLYSNL